MNQKWDRSHEPKVIITFRHPQRSSSSISIPKWSKTLFSFRSDCFISFLLPTRSISCPLPHLVSSWLKFSYQGILWSPSYMLKPMHTIFPQFAWTACDTNFPFNLILRSSNTSILTSASLWPPPFNVLINNLTFYTTEKHRCIVSNAVL